MLKQRLLLPSSRGQGLLPAGRARLALPGGHCLALEPRRQRHNPAVPQPTPPQTPSAQTRLRNPQFSQRTPVLFNLLIRGQLWHYCFCLAAAAAKLHSWAGMSLPFASRSKQVFKRRRHRYCPYASQTDVDAERFGATPSVMKINSLTSSKTAIPIPFVKSGRKLGDVWNLPPDPVQVPERYFLNRPSSNACSKKTFQPRLLFSFGCFF